MAARQGVSDDVLGSLDVANVCRELTDHRQLTSLPWTFAGRRRPHGPHQRPVVRIEREISSFEQVPVVNNGIMGSKELFVEGRIQFLWSG